MNSLGNITLTVPEEKSKDSLIGKYFHEFGSTFELLEEVRMSSE